MKKLLNNLCVVVCTLTVLLLSQTAPLVAQTNFVKYKGNPIVPLGASGKWDHHDISFGSVLFNDSKYKLWFSGSNEPGQELWRIGYATSNDGINWDKYDNNPVLGPGAPGDFDSNRAGFPCVQFNGDYYEMWYNGNLANFLLRIGYATSPDGINWTKYADNPVFDKGSPGAWDGHSVFEPCVLRTDTLYHMWYIGEAGNDIWQTGYATSPDGVNWTRYPDNPVLKPGEAGEWDSYGALVGSGSVLYEGGQYYMWYAGRSQPGPFYNIKIGLATSTDGIHWTKHPDNPILELGTSGSWDANTVWGPVVRKEGHRYQMWYCGRKGPDPATDRFGYAEDFSNAAHVDSVRAAISDTILAGSQAATFWAYISNPHDEEVTAKALIKNKDESTIASVDLIEVRDGQWRGQWTPPALEDSYNISIVLNNITADYVLRSSDWGVFDEFSTILDPNGLSYSFTQIAAINEGKYAGANKVIVASNGAILLANGEDGLRAYTFDGTSFSNIAHVNEGGDAMGVAEGSNGTVFLANGEDGLRAYSFDGTAFTNLAHINEGGSAMDVALADDGTIFLANGEDGLRVYDFDGSSFISKAHNNDFSNDNEARGIAVAPDNTIFLFRDGVWAYTYTGSDFINIWHNSEIGNSKGIAFGTDGTIFLGSFRNIYAFGHQDTSFLKVAADSIDELWPHGISVANETIFIAGQSSPINSGVLAACDFDGSSLTKTAYLNIDCRDITLLSSDTILVTSGFNGLSAYIYSKIPTTAVDNEYSKFPIGYRLYQNYPNPFNPATTIEFTLPQSGFVKLKVYNILGQQVATLLETQKPAGQHVVNFDASQLSSGIYYYTLTADDFKQTRKMVLLR